MAEKKETKGKKKIWKGSSQKNEKKAKILLMRMHQIKILYIFVPNLQEDLPFW